MKRAFLDANVLLNVIGGSKQGEKVLMILRKSGFEIVTFRKCVYEIYSILRGTTKRKDPAQNQPLRFLLPKEINDIAQKLFKKSPDIDASANSYYWYNLCEEWRGWNYFGEMEKYGDSELLSSCNRERYELLLKKQEEFIKWKDTMLTSFGKVDHLIEKENILVCEYMNVFTSDWYKNEGFAFEQTFAKDSLLPNEDFEILLAAFYLQARVFITGDKDILYRTALSFGLNSPSLSFCTPENLEKAIEDKFDLRVYR